MGAVVSQQSTEIALASRPVRWRIGLIVLSTDLTTARDWDALHKGDDIAGYVNRVAFENPMTRENWMAMRQRLSAAAGLQLHLGCWNNRPLGGRGQRGVAVCGCARQLRDSANLSWPGGPSGPTAQTSSPWPLASIDCNAFRGPPEKISALRLKVSQFFWHNVDA